MTFHRSVLWSLLSFSLFFNGCLSLSAQSDCLVQRFTTDNGLPSNGIKGLEWDPATEFLWIATEAGVTRYNGADFLTFSKANTPGLLSERMLFMLKNLEGRIYTSDEAGNVYFVMQNKLQFLGKVPLDTRSSTFKLIGLAASGQLFRQSLGQPPGEFGFNYREELAIPVSEQHIILFHTDSLYDYRIGKKEPELITDVKPGSRVFYLAGQLFVFSRQLGFYRLDRHPPTVPVKIPVRVIPGAGEAIPPVSPGSDVQLFWEVGMPYSILISGSHAWTLSYSNGQLFSRLICTDIPTDALLSFAGYIEKSRTLLLGTNSKGVIIIRKNQVSPVKKRQPAIGQTTAVYSQIALPDGRVLTSQGDILGREAIPPRPPASAPVRGVFNNFVLLTADSLLWYSRGNQIYTYSYKTSRTDSADAGEGSITDGFVLSGDSMYIANARGIGVLRGKKVNYLFSYPKADVNSNVPFAMVEISPGILAIGSCNGLLRYNTQTHGLDTLFSAPGACVRALWKYKDYLFIGTYGKGIYLWRNGVLKALPVDRNNYLLYAHCFIPDQLGFCWISTNRGLFRAFLADMTDAFDKDVREIYYHYYGRNDGMDITELNGGCSPCALTLNDSTVSFPSMDGLLWVDPAGPPDRLPGGDIYIDAFYADGRKVNMASLLRPELPAHTRELTFTLGFPAWADKENIYLEYKLEPYSRDWQLSDMQNAPSLKFSNLPSGSYRLMLRKLNGFGNGNYVYTEVEFMIRAQWYQQWWSWLLGICCLAAAVILIVRLRTRQFQISQSQLEEQISDKTRELQHKNEELEKTDHIKTRLITIISHDLVTPLRFLHLAGKSLIEKKDELPEELQRETITEIMNTAKELELLSTNMLNWIKYKNEDRRLTREHFNLHQLVARIFGIFNAMARQKQIRLINEIEEPATLYQFIEPVRIVLYNLVLNGINFTSEGSITVSHAVNGEETALIITDTGVGMTQEQINNIMADHFIISSANVDGRKGNGLGYLIIKDLLKIVRGSLSIQSEKGRGTRVTIRLTAV